MSQHSFEPLSGTVCACATFEIGPRNPLPSPGDSACGTAIITLMGTAHNSTDLLPVVRFGLADGGRRDPGNTQLMPWASNGRIGYYGDHGRPNTRYTIRIHIETTPGVMDVHVRAEGEEGWFPLAEGVATENRVDDMCELQLEQSPDAGEITDIHVESEVWPESERTRLYRFAKPDRTVKPGVGFHFQRQRSFWRESNRPRDRGPNRSPLAGIS